MSVRWLKIARISIVVGLASLGYENAAQTLQESVSSARAGAYPQLWQPGPPRSSVPEWAAPGQIRFSRWDGGPIESAKAVLSGWPGMNPPSPSILYAMTNWYDPSTVRFLRDAHINLVWVTFSNGFSIDSESVQRDLVRAYIEECHRHGIRVMAYQSASNMFWEDMFQSEPASESWVSMDENGKPRPYGAGNYAKMGRVTRYLADLSNPGWREYVKRRIDLAIDAGADGIMYDNIRSAESHLLTAEFIQDVMQHALGRKSDFLVMVNFHRGKYILNRLINCLTTEDGYEPGVYAAENLGVLRGDERTAVLPVEGGFLVNQMGLFRTFENLSEGWKPAMIETNHREVGDRETHYMRPERQKLAIAEPRMFGVSSELYVELRFAHDLWFGNPDARSAWEAIGEYNRFFELHSEYYRGARSEATLAIVLDNRSEGIGLLNGLAGRKVQYHVLYEHELAPGKLDSHAAVALLSADFVRDEALSALETYVGRGGKLFMAGSAASRDELGKRRQRPQWVEAGAASGRIAIWDKVPPVDELAAALKAADRPPHVAVEAPAGVLHNVTSQAGRGRRIVHLLNYLPRPVEGITVTVKGNAGDVVFLSPDNPGMTRPVVHERGGASVIEVPRLGIYSALVIGGH